MNGTPVETYNNTHLGTYMKWRLWRVHLRNHLRHQVRGASLSWDRHMEMTTIHLSISRHRKWDKNSNCTHLHQNFGTCLPIYRVTWMFVFTNVRSSNFALGNCFLFFLLVRWNKEVHTRHQNENNMSQKYFKTMYGRQVHGRRNFEAGIVLAFERPLVKVAPSQKNFRFRPLSYESLPLHMEADDVTWKPNIDRHPQDTEFRTFISCNWYYSS